MNTPNTTVIGAVTTIVHDITTSICTCCTSLVIRVMSDGEPKRLTSWAEKPVTRWNNAALTSRPNPMAALAAQNTAVTNAPACASVIVSMMRPTDQM